MTTSPPTQAEAESARRFLSDVFAIRMETIGAIAELVVTQEKLGLPDGCWDTYRRDLAATEAKDAAAIAREIYADPALVVVVGDADAPSGGARDLARFGEVTVLDPAAELRTLKTLPASPK